MGVGGSAAELTLVWAGGCGGGAVGGLIPNGSSTVSISKITFWGALTENRSIQTGQHEPMWILVRFLSLETRQALEPSCISPRFLGRYHMFGILLKRGENQTSHAPELEASHFFPLPKFREDVRAWDSIFAILFSSCYLTQTALSSSLLLQRASCRVPGLARASRRRPRIRNLSCEVRRPAAHVLRGSLDCPFPHSTCSPTSFFLSPSIFFAPDPSPRPFFPPPPQWASITKERCMDPMPPPEARTLRQP